MAGGRPQKIPVVFYRTRAGTEVVRIWLRGLEESDRNIIGQDLMRVQYRWPVGMPLCRALRDGLWEIRSDLASLEDDNMKGKKRKTKRSVNHLTTLDQFLKDEGQFEEFEAVAIKEVLAWQIAEAMKAQKLSRKRLAERMKTSRSQISRLLNPKDGNVTIATLQRAAKIVGRTLRLELV